MRKYFFTCAIFVSLFALQGCADTAFAPSQDQPINRTWHKIDDSLARMELFYQVEDQIEQIQIYRITPGSFKTSFYHSTENPKSVEEWADQLNADIVINGSYFNEDFTPSGYLKVGYNRIGKLIFDQNRSGLVQVENNEVTIRDLSVDPLSEGEEVEYGMQSYPFLINNSVRAIKEDSGKVARRTAIGTDAKGNIYLILVDTSVMSLYELMDELAKSDLKFEKVLNLDGGPSSGISINYKGYQEVRDSLSKVPNVIAFSK